MPSPISLLKNLFRSGPSVHKPDWARGYEDYRGIHTGSQVCMAPFKSMYFGHGGSVVVCCYNRLQPLGKFPERSIRDIWFGPEADALRDDIRNYRLDYGCHGCKSMMEAGNYEAVKAKQYDTPPLNKNKYPSVMEFELSNECNLGCVMCTGEFSSYIRKHVEKMPPIPSAYGPEFVEQLAEFIPHLVETKFYGGEPFLIPVYQEIWDKIVELNPQARISVQTNATVLSDRVKKLLEKGIFHVSISLDSLQKERYESIRRNAVQEKVLENVHYLRDYTRRKDSFLGISVCMMRSNWDEAADFVRFCNELDCKVYFHTVTHPESMSLMAWGVEPLDRILKTFEGTVFEAHTPVQRENVLHFEHWIRQIRQWKAEYIDRYTFASRARYIEALRHRIKEWQDTADEPKLLEKLAWMEGLGGTDREMKVTMIQMNDPGWIDQAIRIMVSKTEEELLEMLEWDG